MEKSKHKKLFFYAIFYCFLLGTATIGCLNKGKTTEKSIKAMSFNIRYDDNVKISLDGTPEKIWSQEQFFFLRLILLGSKKFWMVN